jgi:hypothetical protein
LPNVSRLGNPNIIQLHVVTDFVFFSRAENKNFS